MQRPHIKDVLREKILILDGAMGSLIQQYNLTDADYRGERFKNFPHEVKGNNDLLSITRPDVIKEIHAKYFAAGADIAETNTFSGTSIAMADYHMEDLVYELNFESAKIAREVADEFTAKEFFSKNGYWANKWAIQLGFRGSDLFNVQRLNYLAEFNTARPYTYAHFDRISNYGHYNQPLAHPFGANFREFLGLLNYSYKRFDFQGQLVYARYGLDPAGTNYGKDIFKDYTTRVADYGNSVGQGLATNLYIANAKVAYLINPKYNLKLELGGLLRKESNNLGANNTSLITFGLRSSFRNLYQDF